MRLRLERFGKVHRVKSLRMIEMTTFTTYNYLIKHNEVVHINSALCKLCDKIATAILSNKVSACKCGNVMVITRTDMIEHLVLDTTKYERRTIIWIN